MLEIKRLADCPRAAQEAAEWLSRKWGIPEEAYLESIAESIAHPDLVPQWYIVCEDGADEGAIVAGCGIIENDFHDRPDLAPNLCALYVEEDYRGRGLARRLLEHARCEAGRVGRRRLYLVTDHTSFYEKCGWEYLGDVNEVDGGGIRMYGIDCPCADEGVCEGR